MYKIISNANAAEIVKHSLTIILACAFLFLDVRVDFKSGIVIPSAQDQALAVRDEISYLPFDQFSESDQSGNLDSSVYDGLLFINPINRNFVYNREISPGR